MCHIILILIHYTMSDYKLFGDREILRLSYNILNSDFYMFPP